MDRTEWLNRAVPLLIDASSNLHPLMFQKDRPVRLAYLPIDVQAEYTFPEGIITYSNRWFDHDAAQERPWVVLGVLLHELIHGVGVRNHGRVFQEIADAVGLKGRGKQRDLDYQNPIDVPTYVHMILRSLGPIPGD